MNVIDREVAKQKIVAALACGNSRKDSYEYAGVSDTTFRDWLIRDESFAAECLQAEATSKVAAVTRIAAAAAAGSWQAAAWFLERRYPREWGRSEKLDTQFRNMSREQLREFVTDQLGPANGSGAGEDRPPALLTANGQNGYDQGEEPL